MQFRNIWASIEIPPKPINRRHYSKSMIMFYLPILLCRPVLKFITIYRVLSAPHYIQLDSDHKHTLICPNSTLIALSSDVYWREIKLLIFY